MKGTRYAAALVEANGNFVRMWFKNSLSQIENVLKEEMQKNSTLIAWTLLVKCENKYFQEFYFVKLKQIVFKRLIVMFIDHCNVIRSS